MYRDVHSFVQNHLLNKINPDNFLRGRAREDYLINNFPEYYDQILKITNFIDLDHKPILIERLYCILNNITEIPKCQCGKLTKFQKQNKRYGTYCSRKCSEFTKNLLDRNREYLLNNYGVDHTSKVIEFKERKKRNSIEKYGTDSPLKSSEVRDKIQKTMNKKYGGNSPACDPVIANSIRRKLINKTQEEKEEIRRRINETRIRRHGNTNYVNEKIKNSWNNKSNKEKTDIVRKRKETCIARYGVDNPCKTVAIQSKLRDSYYSKSLEVRKLEIDKARETMSIRYGVPNYNQKHLNPKLIVFRKNEIKYKKWLEILHFKKKYTLGRIASYLGIDATIVGTDFNKFGLEVKYFFRSQQELEIISFIKRLDPNLNIVENDRSTIGDELDIFIPSKKIAIEFNGLYWHSYNYIPSVKERRKHQLKVTKCRKMGVRLFTIFENEWEEDTLRSIWKSILGRYITGNSQVIYARNTTIKPVKEKEARVFLENNHIQGFINYSVSYGLFDRLSDELMAVMSFIHNKEDNSWDLNRFCTKVGVTVVGGASKLLKFFESQNRWSRIITFSDFRYSYGDLYYKLGFSLNKELGVSYYYTDKKSIFHRRLFQKKHLNKLLESYDSNKTEFDNVLLSGKYRILYDCGKLKFVKINQKYV